jgi:hypothetical protein
MFLTIKQKAKKSRVCPNCTTKSSQSEASPPCLTKSERAPTSPARLGLPLALRSNTVLRSLHSTWRVESGINAYIQDEPQSAAYKPFDLLDVFMRMSRRCFLPKTGVLDRAWRGPCISFPRSQSIATTPLHGVKSLTCCSSSLRACHSWPISFWRSPTFMCLKSPLAWRLTENCTNALAARLTWRSSLMAGHFFECFGSKVRRSLARAAFAILISLTSWDSTQRLYSASAASLDVWTRWL